MVKYPTVQLSDIKIRDRNMGIPTIYEYSIYIGFDLVDSGISAYQIFNVNVTIDKTCSPLQAIQQAQSYLQEMLDLQIISSFANVYVKGQKITSNFCRFKRCWIASNNEIENWLLGEIKDGN